MLNDVVVRGMREHRSNAFVALMSGQRHQAPGGQPHMCWPLLGSRSAPMEMGACDLHVDESMGPNCHWYADILLTPMADGVVCIAPNALTSRSRRPVAMV